MHETLDRHNVDGRYRKRMAIMCLGFYPRLVVWDPEVAKEVFVTESHCFHKPRLTRILEPLMGACHPKRGHWMALRSRWAGQATAWSSPRASSTTASAR